MGSSIGIQSQKITVDHTSRGKTLVDGKLTLRALDDGVDDILLALKKPLPDLNVTDSTGEELPVIQDEKTLRLLKRQLMSASENSVAGMEHLIGEVENEKIQIVWIKLPPSKRLKKFQHCMISMKYDSEREQRPSSKIRIKYTGVTHSAVYVIKKPKDYEFNGKPAISYTDDRGITKTVNWDFPRNAPIHMVETSQSILLTIGPHAARTIDVVYSFKATPGILVFPYLAVGLLSLAASAIMAFSHCDLLNACSWLEHSSLADLLKSRTQLSMGITAASLVLPRLIQNDSVRHDHKFSFIVPLGLGIASFF